MPFVASIEGNFGAGRQPKTSTPSSTNGSMFFSGASSANLSIANDIDFRIGSGDFTIEWFQYATTVGNSYPRVFSIGSYSSQSIAVSHEGSDSSRTFYAWVSGANLIESGQNYTGRWVHFALSRSGQNLRVFRDGTQIGTTLTNSTNFNNTTDVLRIGNESTVSSGAAFKGYITNFRWVKGSALYTSNFSKPIQPLTAVANTKLLLLAVTSGTVSNDSSGLGKTVTNSDITWSALSPF
jgi:hypothetical protein